ncbi:cytochrome P450 [Microbispora rosea]|uniref:cytochrome P450 n=1 Tax=Microbispora rosea TaxID=58117 RepID=UPI003D8E8D3B
MTVAYLDIEDPDFRPDSADVHKAREANWYARTPRGYAVLRYEPAGELIADRRLRQSTLDFFHAQGITSGPLYDFMRRFLPCLEGEDHARLRGLVSKAFTRRSVDALRPFMRQVTHELVDTFHASGRCDFITDFAEPYSARIICTLLGVPEEQHDSFRGWGDDLSLMVSNFVAQHRDRIETALAGLGSAVDALLAKRRKAPQDDLISRLIAAEEAGDRLTSEELRVMVIGLMLAGQDATQHQLGLAMTTFMKHPEQWALLAEQPELVDRAIEESMRVSPASTVIMRIADEDIVYRDLEIKEGTFVSVLLDPAHNDPAVFNGEGFDITKQRATQLTFGVGLHYCLGAALARAEMGEALPILANRLHSPEPDGPVPWRPTVGVTGPITLPIRFVPHSPTPAPTAPPATGAV